MHTIITRQIFENRSLTKHDLRPGHRFQCRLVFAPCSWPEAFGPLLSNHTGNKRQTRLELFAPTLQSSESSSPVLVSPGKSVRWAPGNRACHHTNQIGQGCLTQAVASAAHHWNASLRQTCPLTVWSSGGNSKFLRVWSKSHPCVSEIPLCLVVECVAK